VTLEASLVKTKLPSTCPLTWGLKLTVSSSFWPGLKVCGRFKPLTPNPIALWVMVKTVIDVGLVLVR
jgi:hypothetical protein